MKLIKSTIAATFAASLIGGMAISPASAKVHETGRVYTGGSIGFEVEGNKTYKTGRVAPDGNGNAILRSQSPNRTNGRQG